jgi:hypothetical protein
MNRARWRQDRRMRKFRDVLSRWEARRPPLDLIVTMDDATGTIYSACVEEERGWWPVTTPSPMAVEPCNCPPARRAPTIIRQGTRQGARIPRRLPRRPRSGQTMCY